MHPDLMTVLNTYSAVLIFIAALPANLFPLVYSRRPWTQTFVGRALMVKAIGIALLVDTSIVRIVAGYDYEWLSAVRAVTYSIVCTGITLQFLALVFSDRVKRRLDREAEALDGATNLDD